MVQKKFTIHRLTVLALSLIMIMSIVGCGSKVGTTSSDKPVASNTPQKGEMKKDVPVIKIGAPFPLTGTWAEGGENSLNGVALAIDDINAAGGIKVLGGAKLELVSADTSSEDPTKAASVTRRLIEQDKVNALIGAYVSNLSLTATTEAEKGKVPIITQSFVDKLTERGYKYTFQIPPKSSSFGLNSIQYIADIIKKYNLNIKKVAFVANNDANSIGSIQTGQKVAKELGFEIVLTETFPPGITDATPVITKIKKADPQLIFTAGVLQDQILIIRSLRSQNINMPIVGMGGGGLLGKGFATALGKQSDNVFSLAAWNWDLQKDVMGDVNKKFQDKYKQPFMPQEAGESYIAVWLIKEAIEKSGNAEPQSIRNQLSTLMFDQGAGKMMVGGKIDFDDAGMNAGVYPVMIEWKDALPHTVWPEKDKVMEPTF